MIKALFDNIGRNVNLEDLEDVKIPVKNIDIVAPIVNEDELPKDTICTICQDVIITQSRKTLCNHFFCCKCIEPWLNEMNKMCPNCLTDLEDLKDLKNKEINEKKRRIKNK